MKTIIVLLLLPGLAWATDKKPMPQPQKQEQHQKQGQQQKSISGAEAAAASTASNEGNSFETNSLVEASAPDIVLIPSNNTSNCMKTYGLSFSSTNGGGGLGWPYRDKSCDFEQAADDAAATGQHHIAWYWRCHKKNLYKQFNGRAKGKGQQIQACHLRMMQMYINEPPPMPDKPEPQVVVCPAPDHPDVHHRIFAACMEK